MTRLIRLEFKKMSLWKYLAAVLVAIIVFPFLVTAPMMMLEENEVLFRTAGEFLIAGSAFIRLFTTILIGVLIAYIIVKEYENGTILNLFLYPISKKKIIVSKIILITVVGLILSLITQLGVVTICTLLSNHFQLFSETIGFEMLSEVMVKSIVLLIGSVAISMIALFFGLRTKSSIVTIVTSVIIGMLINGNLGTSTTLSSNLVIMMGLSLVGCGIVFFSIMNVDKDNI